MAIYPDPKRWQIGLVGYGEVGRILAEDLRKQDVRVAAYDIKLGGDQQAALRDHADKIGVALAASHAELAGSVDFIVSAVTASQAVPVAEACAPAIRQGSWFLDFNSASPGAKHGRNSQASRISISLKYAGSARTPSPVRPSSSSMTKALAI